jgi:oligopeptide transport system substrate-binding protein
LTYYDFNTAREPFDDVRVREALALAIDRERVSRDDLGGATEPAGKFLPEEMSGERPVVDKEELLEYDVGKARDLLAEAGYPDGEGFPIIRLLINRNEQQRIVAQSIAAMWRSALNIDTEIDIRNWDEYEAAIGAGDYDIVRRGLVMQTTSEFINIGSLFERGTPALPIASPEASPGALPSPEEKIVVETESQALKELRAMPIYFASSYSLVKPYVTGFDSNVLDVPYLKKTRLDTNWKHP